MGIRGLKTLIKKKVPGSLRIRPISYYKNTIIAIDVNILLYKACYSYPVKDYNSFLFFFINKCISFLNNGILPIFIFDGKTPIEKKKLLYKRQLTKRNNKERLQQLKNIQRPSFTIQKQIQKLEKKTSLCVTHYHIELLKRLFYSLGIPYFIAQSGEAEQLCACLQKQHIVDYSVSDDTDTLVFGSCSLLTCLHRTNTTLMEWDLNMILSKLKLTFPQFVDFCILTGCDYTDSIPGININESLYYIQKYKTIEQCLPFLQKKYNTLLYYNQQQYTTTITEKTYNKEHHEHNEHEQYNTTVDNGDNNNNDNNNSITEHYSSPSSTSTFFNYKRARELFDTLLEDECTMLIPHIKLNNFQLFVFQTLLSSINCIPSKINEYCDTVQHSIKLFYTIHTKKNM
jgi:flap endonuclease-1